MSEKVRNRLPLEAIRAYCARQPFRRLSLFGSALRDDFGPDSDIDMLIEYAPDARIDNYAIFRQQADLCKLIGRPVDLGTPQSLSPYIRHRGHRQRRAALRCRWRLSQQEQAYAEKAG